MELFETLGRIFSASEKPQALIECPNCGTFSEHEFCSDECENDWECKRIDNEGADMYDSERDKEYETNY